MSKVDGFDDLTTGQLKALCIKLGGVDEVQAILRGERTVKIVDYVLRLLFDKNGRRITKGLKAKVRDAHKGLLARPELFTESDYANRILRLHGCLNIDTEVTAERFMKETERLLAIVKRDPQVANIVNNVCLPLVIPRRATDDLGAQLKLFLAGLKKSSKGLGRKNLRNFCEGVSLRQKVSTVNESKHYQLTNRMMFDPVIGLYFPSSLQGFSVSASREQMRDLPEGFVLSGIDTFVAMMMYPDILYSGLGMNLSALQFHPSGVSFELGTMDNEFYFTSKKNLDDVRSDVSSGLLFIG